MLQVNDDINDELFRRAAESYPLKTDNADWGAVVNKMSSVDTTDEPVVNIKKRKNNYRFLLLLLLIIPLVIFENINPTSHKNTSKNNNDKNDITTTPKIKTAENNENSTLKNKTEEPILTADVTQPDSFHSDKRLYIRPASQNTNILASSPVEKVPNENIKQTYTSGQKSKMNIYNSQPEGDDQQITETALTKSNKHKKKMNGSSAIAIKEGSQENIDIEKKEITVADNKPVQQKATETEIAAAITDKPTDPVVKTDSIKDSTKIDITKTTQEKENKKTLVDENKKKKSAKKHFYAGLIIGPDFSTIKLQSVKKTGLSYGFLLGYRFNKKWSIETGLLQDRKYYSTDGKYFNTKDLNYPPSYKIEYVTGVCKMLELPLNIRYTFYKRSRSGLFGSAGVSAFFMQHESYIYDINYYGNRYSRSYEYDNKSKSIPAIVNISAGYTYTLGKIGDLRIEPYIKMPISKIGTGKLPIQSGGVFIIFTKDIF